MTVGHHAPPEKARSGVADYAAALERALRRRAIVVRGAARAGVHLYHLGNNGLHADIYRLSLERPGVTVLHDANLHHFYLGTLSRGEYIEEFVWNYGEWHRGFAADLWQGRARSAAGGEYFRYPMLRRAAEAARVVVVHNQAARRAVLRHAPGTRVEVIPHYFAAPDHLPREWEVTRWRARLGVPRDTLLVGVFGHLRESKRLGVVLRAMRGLRGAVLLVAGDFVSPGYERALEPRFTPPSVLRLGYLEEHEFWLAAMAADVCVNLRYPACGESSGIATRLMGLGKPVVVSEVEETAGPPETACLRVRPGAGEEDELAAWIEWLRQDRQAARAIGRRAADFVARHQSLEAVAERYCAVLEEAGA